MQLRGLEPRSDFHVANLQRLRLGPQTLLMSFPRAISVLRSSNRIDHMDGFTRKNYGGIIRGGCKCIERTQSLAIRLWSPGRTTHRPQCSAPGTCGSAMVIG